MCDLSYARGFIEAMRGVGEEYTYIRFHDRRIENQFTRFISTWFIRRAIKTRAVKAAERNRST